MLAGGDFQALGHYESFLTDLRAQAPDLQRIHKRIQDIVGVLRDFGAQREEGRSRAEYLHRLQRDLATYYSYGDFLLGKLMDLFPLSEVLNCQMLLLSCYHLSSYPGEERRSAPCVFISLTCFLPSCFTSWWSS